MPIMLLAQSQADTSQQWRLLFRHTPRDVLYFE